MLQVKSGATDEEIEDVLSFQLEELAIMAEEELALIPMMAGWKPWEVVSVTHPPSIPNTQYATDILERCLRV